MKLKLRSVLDWIFAVVAAALLFWHVNSFGNLLEVTDEFVIRYLLFGAEIGIGAGIVAWFVYGYMIMVSFADEVDTKKELEKVYFPFKIIDWLLILSFGAWCVAIFFSLDHMKEHQTMAEIIGMILVPAMATFLVGGISMWTRRSDLDNFED